MSLLRRKGLFESTKVLFLPIAAISPNPDQPRTCFSREGLEELAASIQELGVLQPLSVRRSKNGGYELISGERRLRASLHGRSHRGALHSGQRGSARALLCWPWWRTFSGGISTLWRRPPLWPS